MMRGKMGMNMLLATMLSLGGSMGGREMFPGLDDDPDSPRSRRRPEKKGPPRQAEVDELNKKQRKVYSRVMRETEDREMALKAARET